MTKPGFYQPIERELAKVEEILVRATRTDDEKVTALLGHVVASGGKRLRPVLTLLCGRLVEAARGRSSGGDDLVQAAAGIEAFHTASLVHDDLVEGAPVRRGRSTVNHLWGPPAAVLVGDCYLALAIDLMAGVANAEVYRAFSRAIREVAQGVIEELIPRRSSLATLEAARKRYFRIIELKTAALLASACEIGAVIGGADAAERVRIRELGTKIGQALQIADDVLDFTGEVAETGKHALVDVRRGVVTHPLLHVIFRSGADPTRLARILDAKEPTPEDVEFIAATARTSGAIEASRAEALRIAGEAQAILAGYPEVPARSALLDVSRYVVERTS